MIDNVVLLAADAHEASAVADWMVRWFNVTQPWEVWWLGLGLVAQFLFFGRWLVQWFASERRGESYIPTLFWWCSLIGATMLLIYFIGRREPIGVLGQCVGWIVYSRNLYLIRRSDRSIVEQAKFDVDEPLPIPDDEGSEAAIERSREASRGGGVSSGRDNDRKGD